MNTLKIFFHRCLAVRNEYTLKDQQGQVLIRVSGPYAEQAIALFAHAMGDQ